MNRRPTLCLVVCITAILTAYPCWSAQIETHFSPRGDCAATIIKHLDAATTSIDVAAYQFTSEPLGKAIERAMARRVSIRVLVDRTQEGYPAATLSGLKKAGVALRTDRGERLMHNKFAVIDSTVTITGSYNWTRNAEINNSENLIVIRDDTVAAAYAANFATHWEHAQPFAVLPPKQKKVRYSASHFPLPLTLAHDERPPSWHSLLVPCTPIPRLAPLPSPLRSAPGRAERSCGNASIRPTRSPPNKWASAR
jgi:phosphatidylserine/phosphatidylglycerophosphate/cardiolipin synthase-like enzyme